MVKKSDDENRDLDETRRLLYMGLVAGLTKRYNLAGTLINALMHHGPARAGTPHHDVGDLDGTIDRVVDLVEGVGTSHDGAKVWARDLITQITEELDQ